MLGCDDHKLLLVLAEGDVVGFHDFLCLLGVEFGGVLTL